MLLRRWQWRDGSRTSPDRPCGHLDFPRHDLLRHADDPNPRMRRLALDDSKSTPELVERLSRDSGEEVRRRAVTDPRLSPAAAHCWRTRTNTSAARPLRLVPLRA
ncbi:hypothetical protein [Streptomyces sviceus]|uniref:hypothetical protein n=1 Tax=Streptomyces sviceus TaxID=285530 RepID=UPI0036A6F897